MTPNEESLRLLEESVMNQHVAVPRNSYKSTKDKEANNSNNNNNNNSNTNDTNKSGGNGMYNGGGGPASGDGKNGKKRVYQTKAKKEQELMMMLNGGLAALPSQQEKPVKKAKKAAVKREKKIPVKREMVNGDHSSYATPANSSLGVTPDATPSSRAASVGPNGVAVATTAPSTVTGGRKLNNTSFRRAAETPSIVTPTIPIVPNRRKKFSAPRKSPDM
jgi:hypothetical protein